MSKGIYIEKAGPSYMVVFEDESGKSNLSLQKTFTKAEEKAVHFATELHKGNLLRPDGSIYD